MKKRGNAALFSVMISACYTGFVLSEIIEIRIAIRTDCFRFFRAVGTDCRPAVRTC